MKLNGYKTIAALFLLMSFHCGHAQGIEQDTREMLDIIKKWNYANNWKSEATFRSIYAETLLFYTETLTREQCIDVKQKFFRAYPDFKQKIITDPVFTPFGSGVVKSEFIKEVYQNGTWKKYPSYLLISYENGKYVITGESDEGTDRVLQYDLNIEDPVEIPPSKRNTIVSETAPSPDSSDETVSDSLNEASTKRLADTILTPAQASEDSTLLTEIYEKVLSDDAVTVPRKYVYGLIGFLVVLGIIVMFSRPEQGRIPVRRPKRHRVSGIYKDANAWGRDPGFENFVIRLFDPHYFNISVGSRQRVMAGNGHGRESLPHIDLEFHSKDITARFALVCLYIPQVTSVYVLSRNQMKAYHDLQEETGEEVYLIIGLGGEPDDPKEIYLIKASDVRPERIMYSDLEPFRKSGMVFYSTATKRLR